MGGLFHLFEFNQRSMAKKLHTQKRNHAGQEALGNSLDLQLEAFKTCCPEAEISYYRQVGEDWSENNCSNVASVKKLINKELSERSSGRQNAPSLVARLMGIDMMPLDTNSGVHAEERKSKIMAKKISRNEMHRMGSAGRGSSNSKFSSQKEINSFYQDIYYDGWSPGPRPWEHTQEEELQKFTKEFEAFQASHRHGHMRNIISAKQRSFPSRSRTLSRDFEGTLLKKSHSRVDSFSSPTRITILKPGPESIGNHEENWMSSSCTLRERNSIEDFLEEVRQQLKCELNGKTLKKVSVVEGVGIPATYSDNSSDSKRIASHIANQVRERMTRGVGMNLLRSQSTRSYRSDISEFEEEMQTGSLRHESDEKVLLYKELCPRSLVRSLSAPVSGTSFGKLLLEEPHLSTGAHIRRKLEATETVSYDVKRRKNNRFSIKEKLSNFRHSFTFRGRLFGKRIQSKVKSHSNEYGQTVRDVTSVPTVLARCGERHENFTEVPPSPVSVCSIAQEELLRQKEFLSPVSTPDESSREDSAMPQVFRDINSNLNELRKQLNQLDSDSPDDSPIKQEPLEPELVQLEDPAESYIRDLLVASGLYYGSWDRSLLRRDTFAKPIGNSVFEEVEESHRKLAKENESSIKGQNETNLEHKILLDLLNEALSVVLGPPLTLSRFRWKLGGSSSLTPPHGKGLLKLVWDIIRDSLYHPSDMSSCSVDSMVAHYLGNSPWSGLINGEINVMEKQIECVITEGLVEELTEEMFSDAVRSIKIKKQRLHVSITLPD